ncbi:MAG: DUF3226 domain-containing protein [Peptostreptococcaceae bacterium]
MKNYIFFVEGAHDANTVGKVLKLNGFEECKLIQDLPKMWQDRVPKSYPFEMGRLERFTPIPDYYRNNNIFVVVVVSNGEQNIIKEVDLYLTNMNKKELVQIDGLGLIFDADQVTPNEKIRNLLKILDKKEYCFRSDDFMRGVIRLRGECIKLHYYYFPDNYSKGTLEDLLLEAANIVYQDLLYNVEEYIDKIDDRYKENWSVSSENKVKIGCIANIFRPASANQISIMRDKWISEESIESSNNIKRFYEFITNIVYGKE